MLFAYISEIKYKQQLLICKHDTFIIKLPNKTDKSYKHINRILSTTFSFKNKKIKK